RGTSEREVHGCTSFLRRLPSRCSPTSREQRERSQADDVTKPLHDKLLRLLSRLDEPCKFLECHPPTGFVVGWRNTRRYIVVDAEHICAAVCFSKGEGDCHLSAHRVIVCLELHDFDHLLIRHELDEAAVVCVGVCGRLATPSRRVVCERDAERT